jgi:hypothetical protein
VWIEVAVHGAYSLRLQPGEFYFQSGLMVDLFGIADDLRWLQWNYLLTEGHWPKEKGVNCVASMLHHYISSYQPAKEAFGLVFNTDNCE